MKNLIQLDQENMMEVIFHLVELIQVAPFGDPIYLDMNGTHLAIRKEMAREIIVEILLIIR